MVLDSPIISGSAIFLGNLIVTGSITTSGSITISGSIASASYATTSSYTSNATTSSYAVNATTSSYAVSATTASYAINSTTASYAVNATTASYALNTTTASYALSASYATSTSLFGDVFPLSITSNTASLNVSTASFFTLQLNSGQNCYINPTNIKAGASIAIVVSTIGSATISFPPSVKQPSGSLYVPTTSIGKDIITFISFDASSLYLTSVKNLI